MNRTVFLILTVCFISAALSNPATNPSPTVDPQLDAQLTQIDAAARQIKDLSAHFEQDKFTALLKKPLISIGTVRSAGSVIRWDTDQPQPCSLYADQKNLILYYPAQKLEEIYPIDQRVSDLLSSPLPRLDTIKKHFTIKLTASSVAAPAGTLSLRLTPNDPELARHIQLVNVVLDIKTGLTLQVQTVDADGDRTQITFAGAQTNTGLDPSRLELQIPADTTVSHPADSAPADQSSNTSP
jgi:outer membrane lipoprotein-sorting protein